MGDPIPPSEPIGIPSAPPSEPSSEAQKPRVILLQEKLDKTQKSIDDDYIALGLKNNAREWAGVTGFNDRVYYQHSFKDSEKGINKVFIVSGRASKSQDDGLTGKPYYSYFACFSYEPGNAEQTQEFFLMRVKEAYRRSARPVDLDRLQDFISGKSKRADLTEWLQRQLSVLPALAKMKFLGDSNTIDFSDTTKDNDFLIFLNPDSNLEFVELYNRAFKASEDDVKLNANIAIEQHKKLKEGDKDKDRKLADEEAKKVEDEKKTNMSKQQLEQGIDDLISDL